MSAADDDPMGKDIAVSLPKRMLRPLIVAAVFVAVSYLLEEYHGDGGWWDNSAFRWCRVVALALGCYSVGLLVAAGFEAVMSKLLRISELVGTLAFYGIALTDTLPHLAWTITIIRVYDRWPVYMEATAHLDRLALLLIIITILNAVRAVALRYLVRHRLVAQYASLSQRVAAGKVTVFRLSRAAGDALFFASKAGIPGYEFLSAPRHQPQTGSVASSVRSGSGVGNAGASVGSRPTRSPRQRPSILRFFQPLSTRLASASGSPPAPTRSSASVAAMSPRSTLHDDFPSAGLPAPEPVRSGLDRSGIGSTGAGAPSAGVGAGVGAGLGAGLGAGVGAGVGAGAFAAVAAVASGPSASTARGAPSTRSAPATPVSSHAAPGGHAFSSHPGLATGSEDASSSTQVHLPLPPVLPKQGTGVKMDGQQTSGVLPRVPEVSESVEDQDDAKTPENTPYLGSADLGTTVDLSYQPLQPPAAPAAPAAMGSSSQLAATALPAGALDGASGVVPDLARLSPDVAPHLASGGVGFSVAPLQPLTHTSRAWAEPDHEHGYSAGASPEVERTPTSPIKETSARASHSGPRHDDPPRIVKLMELVDDSLHHSHAFAPLLVVPRLLRHGLPMDGRLVQAALLLRAQNSLKQRSRPYARSGLGGLKPAAPHPPLHETRKRRDALSAASASAGVAVSGGGGPGTGTGSVPGKGADVTMAMSNVPGSLGAPTQGVAASATMSSTLRAPKPSRAGKMFRKVLDAALFTTKQGAGTSSKPSTAPTSETGGTPSSSAETVPSTAQLLVGSRSLNSSPEPCAPQHGLPVSLATLDLALPQSQVQECDAASVSSDPGPMSSKPSQYDSATHGGNVGGGDDGHISAPSLQPSIVVGVGPVSSAACSAGGSDQPGTSVFSDYGGTYGQPRRRGAARNTGLAGTTHPEGLGAPFFGVGARSVSPNLQVPGPQWDLAVPAGRLDSGIPANPLATADAAHAKPNVPGEHHTYPTSHIRSPSEILLDQQQHSTRSIGIAHIDPGHRMDSTDSFLWNTYANSGAGATIPASANRSVSSLYSYLQSLGTGPSVGSASRPAGAKLSSAKAGQVVDVMSKRFLSEMMPALFDGLWMACGYHESSNSKHQTDTSVRQPASSDAFADAGGLPPELRSLLGETGDTDGFSGTRHLLMKDLSRLVGDEVFAAISPLLDVRGDGRITAAELLAGLNSIAAEWRTLKGKWLGQATVSRALSITAAAMFAIASFISWLLVFRLSVTAVLLPLGTFAVALAFAVGPSISSAVMALVYLIAYSPYEVGDRVAVENLAGGATMYVHSIDVLTTTFRLLSGKLVQVSNAKLAGMHIFNHRRSKEVTFEVNFRVSAFTSPEQLEAVKKFAVVWLRRHPLRWRVVVDLIVDYAYLGPNNLMQFSLWITHLYSWQEGHLVWEDHGKFVHAVLAAMRRLGIEYQHAVQPVRVTEGPPTPKGGPGAFPWIGMPR